MENQADQKPTLQSERKNRILGSAIQLFKEDGFYNVSIEDIVKATDSSTGSFYNYFGSKDELVISYRRELLSTCHGFYNQMQEDDAYADKNALYKLKAFTEHVLELLAAVSEEFGRVFLLRRLKETDAVPEDKPYYPLLIKLIEAGQEDKSIRCDYPSQNIADIVDFFIIGCHIEWLIKKDTCDIAQNNITGLNMLFNGISFSCVRSTPKNIYFSEIWADAMSRAAKDIRSDIKSLEDQWLERLYGTKSY